MPRVSRSKSESGLYHVMLRRSGRQILFEDDSDRAAFLATTSRVLDDEGLELLAWCLMDNHVHFVICDHGDSLSRAMKRIGISYALRLNRKSGHVGHVFQGRFLSKPIDDDRYLLEVIRYVHNNPVEAHVGRAEDYPWSSYAEYACGREGTTSTALVLDMLDGPEGFVEFVSQGTPKDAPELLGRAPETDKLLAWANEAVGFSAAEIGQLPKAQRDERLRQLEAAGLSIRQIERVTGIGRNTVSRALHNGGSTSVPNCL